MRATASLLVIAVALAACGGGGSGGGAAPPPPIGVTPPPPAPPPPPPPPTYRRFVELTGDQTFRTACQANEFGLNPPSTRPATPFGQGLTLAYTAATDSNALSGDGVATSFAPADRDPAAPAGSIRFLKTVNGFPQRFAIGTPMIGGTAFDYTRGFSLTVASFSGRPLTYNCVFGVPTIVGDAPAGSNFPFARVMVNGAAYVAESGSTFRSYSLTSSTATFTANTTTGRISATLRLVGIEQTPAGPTGGEVQLGEYTATGDIDASVGSYSGSFIGNGATPNATGTFGGWFFGPQAAETALLLNLVGNRPGTGFQMTVSGSITAFRQ